MLYPRVITERVNRLAQLYPVLGITGPRQSGKTTLAKFLFPNLPYVSLENLDIRLEATEDPRAFLAKYVNGAIFDEVQNTPDLLSYLQQIVDDDPRKGRYVITGSQNFALSAHIAQSLSGRIGMLTLLPLSLKELNWRDVSSKEEIHKAIYAGGYPRLHHDKMQPSEFYSGYIQTYIERDVRQLKNIGDLGSFGKFLKLCAGRIGQVVNFSSLALDAGISNTTAKQWLTVLEASYIIFPLQSYYKNFSKRLIKMPKLYFYDTGLACSLLGIGSSEQLDSHYLKGGLFENLMILEVLKGRMNKGLPGDIYFWRDQTGHEIDLICAWGGVIHAVEIKSGATLQSDYTKNIDYFIELSKKVPEEPVRGYLLYSGAQAGMFRGVELLPIQKIDRLFDEK
ncbi:MAG: ATP-binding protein [Pseudomonadota bacterium]